MKVQLNDKEMIVPDSTTVEQLKESLKISGSCAVAVNGKIVASKNHTSHLLAEGDEIIVIGAAYGG